LSSRSPNGGH